MKQSSKINVYNMLLFVFKRVTKQWSYLIISILALIMTAGLQFGIPQITQRIIDDVIPNQDQNQLLWQLALLLLMALALNILNYLSTYLISLVSQTAIVDLRVDLYEHTLKQDFSFFEAQKTGDLMTRFTSDIGTIQNLISPNTLGLIGNIITFIFVLSFMLVKDWRLTLLIGLTFPLLFLLNRFFSSHIKAAYKKVRGSTARINNQLQTSLTSVLLIKNFATESYETSKFQAVNEENKENLIKASKLQALFSPTIDMINYLGMALVLGYGSFMVMKGNLSVGEVVSYLAYLKLLQNPMRAFSQMVSRLQQALVSYERITEVFMISPQIVDKPKVVDFPVMNQGISIKSVHFGYEEMQEVLKDISFELPYGKVTALIGSSGSGKTTVTRLLTRLYDPTKGDILVDGKELKSYGIQSLRQNIGIVTQDIEIIDGTIKENILYGSPYATEDELLSAARGANILKFIESLPNKFETKVGERGIKLSGGQKQRIAIARVFLKNAPLLILDEATAALDNESERHIQGALEALMKDRTSLVIAHRLSTIHHADNILVMESGSIVESGNHQELIASSGRYKELYQAQFD
ncbi:ABC transporter ATP-binding protein/permease [Clostridium sp. MSJ-4]|uniref:ABC transporter ATP-binding protein/permease n=1 Tax=Clostridium simiarum TaxID=2841506 RepID=A0ABS6F1Q7_9CLOT|nr:ABC transporter ATP-binding protein [Clostridium simiarum]MBU5592442.1 ABC transporter ATP-binding protein/permease [Clostridium simiarum]